MGNKKTRANLISLPAEVLAIIFGRVDRNSLVALKRVCHAFTSLDDRLFWEDLHLTLPRYFGVLPCIQPHAHPEDYSGDSPLAVVELDYYSWLKEETDSTEIRFQLAMRDKVRRVLKAGDDRSWGSVRAMTIAPRLGSVHLMMVILDYVQGNLETLHVDPSPLHPFSLIINDRRLTPFPLNPTILDFPLTLTSLTHIQLSNLPTRDGEFLFVLCGPAPNLLSLDVTFDLKKMDPFDADAGPRSYRRIELTKLRSIRCVWDELEGLEDCPAAELFIGLLRCSPALRQVILSDNALFEEIVLDRISDALVKQVDIRELRWAEGLFPQPCERLLRLASGDTDLMTALDSMYDIALLEALYLNQPPPRNNPERRLPPRSSDIVPSTVYFLTMISTLQSFPYLRTVRRIPIGFQADLTLFNKLEELDESDRIHAVTIASMKCAKLEMIQFTFPREWREIDDRPLSEVTQSYPAPEYDAVPYVTSRTDQPVLRQRLFKREPEPVMNTLAHYQGHLVPPEVILKMRDMAGNK